MWALADYLLLCTSGCPPNLVLAMDVRSKMSSPAYGQWTNVSPIANQNETIHNIHWSTAVQQLIKMGSPVLLQPLYGQMVRLRFAPRFNHAHL
jgi:hypothetical protein